MRVMGIDYGDVRTGIAVSDIFKNMSSGVATVKAYTNERLIEEIRPYITQYTPETIVLGLPVNMDGSMGARAEKAKNFAKELENAFGIDVVLYDERCSTMLAHNILNTTDTRGKKRKDVVDTLSAEIILQNYLDSQRKGL